MFYLADYVLGKEAECRGAWQAGSVLIVMCHSMASKLTMPRKEPRKEGWKQTLPVTCHAFVIAPLFMLLIAKVFDCLVVDERVCGSSASLRVCLVHGLPEFCAVLHPELCQIKSSVMADRTATMAADSACMVVLHICKL